MRIAWLGFVFLVACGGGGRGSPDAQGGDGGGGTGAACGGLAGGRCSASEYCDYTDNGCGVGDTSGTCKARPAACPLIAAMPTCACDGNVYAGSCAAYAAGVDLNAHGTCDVIAGRFACGYTQCDLASQYCQRDPQRGAPDTFTCMPLGSCSGTPTCACLASQPCGNACAGDARVGLTLTCPPKP